MDGRLDGWGHGASMFPVLGTEEWSSLRPAESVEKVPGRTTFGAEGDRSKEGTGSPLQSAANASGSSPPRKAEDARLFSALPLGLCFTCGAEK
jgi:hypothetical protein